jgi:hypothetical protein
MKYDSDEYRALMEKRKAAGRLIDPQTCEMTWWYAQTLDYYGDFEPDPETNQVGREYFVRMPGGITVHVSDLPGRDLQGGGAATEGRSL